MGESILTAQNLSKVVPSAEGELTILHPLSLELNKGDSLAIVGASGSGKSTLLGLLAGLDLPSQGEVILESKDFEAAAALASKLSDKTAISNISFLLSREVREAEERKLLKEAAQAFKDRALAAANAFGFSGYRLSKLELGGSGGPVPMPRMMGAAAMAKDASGGYSPDVPLEAGNVTVSIAVNGTIVLQ